MRARLLLLVRQVLTMEWIQGERLRTAGTTLTERSEGAEGGGAAGGGGGQAGPRAAYSAEQRAADLSLVEVGRGGRGTWGAGACATKARKRPWSAALGHAERPWPAGEVCAIRAHGAHVSYGAASCHVQVGVRCSLEQMLEEGFYHAGEGGSEREGERREGGRGSAWAGSVPPCSP